MNKQDLISSMSELGQYTKTDADWALKTTFNAIAAALEKGEEVRIPNFGTFKVHNKAATTGRNPHTGESINIPASKQPKFTAGKGLKDLVNK